MGDMNARFDLYGRLMDVSTLRARVIAHNVANESTPGYRRQDVRFDELFRKALKGDGADAASRIPPEVYEPLGGAVKPNGNNVTFEEEYATSVKNQILFDVMSQAVRSHFTKLREAVNIR